MEESPTQKAQEMMNKIETILNSGKNQRVIEQDVNREFKKIKNLINSYPDMFPQDQKTSFYTKEKKIREKIEKLKSHQLLSQEEKQDFRQQIIGILRTIEKKVAQLNDKGQNKKRQMTIEFYRFHEHKLTELAEWLPSPNRKFSGENMRTLVKYLNDLHVSHEDSVFQDELKELYAKIAEASEQGSEISHDIILRSWKNCPRINDYLPSKQTKQNLHRNSMCPSYKMVDLSVISRMPKEVLSLMFYYHKGEPEQYLAARELMRRSWRFYKRFNIWLKRINEATLDGNKEFEVGNYYCIGSELILREQTGIKVFHKHLLHQL